MSHDFFDLMMDNSFLHQATAPFRPMFCPLIHLASSLARNATIFAMSSGSPNRLNADKDASRSITSFDLPLVNSAVFVGPGDMEFTLIPLAPTSLENTRVNCSTAALVAT